MLGIAIDERRSIASKAARRFAIGRRSDPGHCRLRVWTLSWRALALALLLPVAACQPSASSAVALERSPAGLDQVPLTITTANGKTHKFVVEVARTPEEQTQGLMNRQSMPPDRGMIFPYEPPQAVAFWMKNTLIPLDMIFVAPGGKILRIEDNAVPLSLEPVGSGEAVEAVLELNGGRAAALGLAAGDQVAWKH
jgi:uncharacterized membrane protein (UPF0127 family)